MTKQLLGLDIGTTRTGVALAPAGVKIAAALTTLDMDEDFLDRLDALAAEHSPELIVIGYPRNQQGETTAQTEFVEGEARKIEERGYEVVFQDESVTSVVAERNLSQRQPSHTKADIDAEAARIILQDYLELNR
ncbi:Holliday junction resolvase RuvX [Candidatus Nomurabacteria bacterium]|nr:Holliday junction resolvase RuvX [Candidatus Nomurabacteria bacterium]